MSTIRSMAWLILWCVFHCVFLCAQGVPPEVMSSNSVINRVEEQKDVDLSCQVDSSDVAISWYFNNIPVENETNRLISHSPLSSNLSLKRIIRESSGWYTCRATNVEGYSYRDFLVAVGAAPAISIQPASVNTTMGTTVPFACVADGIPAPYIQWFRSDMPGQALPTCGNSTLDVCVNDTADFQLVVRATSNTVADMYYCSCMNEFRSVESSRAGITALPDPLKPERPPPSSLKSFYHASPNKMVQLDCFSGSASVTVSWSRNGKELSRSKSFITVQGPDARGVYCCHLRSNTTAPVITSYCTYVLPQSNPTIGTSPPPLITVEVNRSICLVCDADGVIAPEINWLRESATLQSNAKDGYNITADRQNVRLSHFVVLDAKSSDSGMYQCRARNSINTTTGDFQISVVSPVASSNLLLDPGAEVSNSMEGPWEYQSPPASGQMASKKNVLGENVFEISYGETMSGDELYIKQSFVIPANVTQVQMSARMRQDASTLEAASPLLALQVASETSYMEWADPDGRAWQWVAKNVTIGTSQSGADHNATVVMNVTLISSTKPNGTVYFDDVSVVPLVFEPEQPTSDLLLIVTIASSVGGVVLLLAAVIVVLVVCCCCCYYCGCCKRHNNAEPMRKESVKKRFSNWTMRYRGSHPTIAEDDVAHDNLNYTSLRAVGPESVYTSPGKDTPLYASLARAGVNNSLAAEGIADSGEVKGYYYIKQPASVPERKVSSVPASSASSLLPPPNRDKSCSQSSLASRELPPIPDVNGGTVTDSLEPTEDYLQIISAASPPVAGKQEVVNSYVDANLELKLPDEKGVGKEPVAAGEMNYTNEDVGPQRSHSAVGRQPTYDKVYMNEEVEPQNSHLPVSRQPTYENAESAPSRPVLRHQATSEEVYVVMMT